MLALDESIKPDPPEWQHFYEKLQNRIPLASLVLTAWQIGLWFAKILVEQQLNERAKQPQTCESCRGCGRRLESKGFVSRRMLTLVGWVEWKRIIPRSIRQDYDPPECVLLSPLQHRYCHNRPSADHFQMCSHFD